MKKLNRLISLITILGLTCGVSFTQTITKPKAQSSAPQQAVPPAATSNPVTGSGTVGRIAKWTGVDGANSFTLGNTNIFEDKFGKVGIGTTTPTSPLTVQGMIETTLGGYKFPDGTVQTTAPSINGLKGAVMLMGTNGISITPFGNNTLNVGVTGQIRISVDVPFGFGAVIDATNTGAGGIGVVGIGGPGSSASHPNGGEGMFAVGGDSLNGNGGVGLFTIGGNGFGTGNTAGPGILAKPGSFSGGATAGLAGLFLGNVDLRGDVSVTGNLSKGGGSFKIDHPLDPENKYLYHSFVESPDMKNIYDGVAKLDANGEAVIEMPAWFGTLNRDFRYLLTPIGAPAPGLYVAEEFANNRFKVAGGIPGMKVSWQVTGIRQDAFANKNRIPVEEAKSKEERGYYLHPEAFNQPEEKSITRATDPEGLKKRRQDVEQMRKQKPEQR